jgi:uncharacterized membrane protein
MTMPAGNAVTRQRGAISVLAAVILVVAVLVVALAVDVGRVIHQRQQLQGAADAAALSAVRALAEGGDTGSVAAAAQAAAAGNGYDGDLNSEAGAVELGQMVRQDGLRQFVAQTPYDAVRVNLRRNVPRSLIAGGLLPGEVTLGASAAAQLENIGGLRIGSFLAGIDTQQSPLFNELLGKLLGTHVALDAVGYNGLLASRVTLRDLVDAGVGIGSVEELLEANLGLGEWLQLMARAMQNRGDTLAASVNNLGIGADSALRLTIGELLAVEHGDSALDATLNVFDLLLASAQVANAGHAVNLDLGTAGTLLANLGLADLQLTLDIIEGPRIAIGPPGRDPESNEWRTRVETGQLGLQLSLTTLQLNLLGLVNTAVKLDLFLEAAQAEAWLETIEAATPSDPVMRAQVGARTSALRLGIGKRNGAAVTPSTLLDVNLLLLHLRVTAASDTTVGTPQSQTLNFAGPFVPYLETPSAANTQRIGTDLEGALSNAVSDLLANTQLTVQGLNVGAVTAALNGILGPLLDNLAVSLLTPLLSALGVQVGGADVTVIYLTGGQPQLIQ